jgi:hypothetical protein
MRLSVTTSGALDIPTDLETHPQIIRGLQVAAEHVLQVSNDRVPLETGTLMRSGRAVVDRSRGTASVSYDTPYAARQHEDLTMRHGPGRQAKYLESAIDDTRDDCLRIIARAVQRALGTS